MAGRYYRHGGDDRRSMLTGPMVLSHQPSLRLPEIADWSALASQVWSSSKHSIRQAIAEVEQWKNVASEVV